MYLYLAVVFPPVCCLSTSCWPNCERAFKSVILILLYVIFWCEWSPENLQSFSVFTRLKAKCRFLCFHKVIGISWLHPHCPPPLYSTVKAQPNEKLRSLLHEDGAYARYCVARFTLVGTKIKATQ